MPPLHQAVPHEEHARRNPLLVERVGTAVRELRSAQIRGSVLETGSPPAASKPRSRIAPRSAGRPHCYSAQAVLPGIDPFSGHAGHDAAVAEIALRPEPRVPDRASHRRFRQEGGPRHKKRSASRRLCGPAASRPMTSYDRARHALLRPAAVRGPRAGAPLARDHLGDLPRAAVAPEVGCRRRRNRRCTRRQHPHSGAWRSSRATTSSSSSGGSSIAGPTPRPRRSCASTRWGSRRCSFSSVGSRRQQRGSCVVAGDDDIPRGREGTRPALVRHRDDALGTPGTRAAPRQFAASLRPVSRSVPHRSRANRMAAPSTRSSRLSWKSQAMPPSRPAAARRSSPVPASTGTHTG